MITSGPEFDKFLVEPGMEIKPFDMKLSKKYFLIIHSKFYYIILENTFHMEVILVK